MKFPMLFIIPAVVFCASPTVTRAGEVKDAAKFTNQWIEAQKRDLPVESAQWETFIRKGYSEQMAHLKSQETLRLAFERKVGAEWEKFYVLLEAMKPGDRAKAYNDFERKTQEQRAQFNREEGKREAKFSTALAYENHVSQTRINGEMHKRVKAEMEYGEKSHKP
ncbi:MAG: hypothetical protein KGL04_04765 [Elusimicrobia bacterium]|nr:hypothetical protein [Elusimicrobiota bacterium]